jgi:hypothetical protein
MRRLLLSALAVACVSVAVPFHALANDIPDGQACDAKADGTQDVVLPSGAGNRGYICLREGGMTVFYIGGALTPSSGSPCGSITVAGVGVIGDNNWDKTDGSGTDDQPGALDGIIPPTGPGDTSGHCD